MNKTIRILALALSASGALYAAFPEHPGVNLYSASGYGFRSNIYDDGRLTVFYSDLNGISKVLFFGADTPKPEVLHGNCCSTYGNIARLDVIIDGEPYRPKFEGVEHYPFGYVAHCRIGDVKFAHELVLDNDVIFRRLRVLENPSGRKVRGRIAIQSSVVPRKAAAWDECIAYDRKTGRIRTQVADKEGDETFVTRIEIGANVPVDFPLNLLDDKLPFRQRNNFWMEAVNHSDETVFYIAFNPAKDVDVSSARIDRKFSRYRRLVAEGARFTTGDALLDSALNSVCPTVIGYEYPEVPGATRAGPYYKVWLWDSLVHLDAFALAGHAGYVKRVLEFFFSTAGETGFSWEYDRHCRPGKTPAKAYLQLFFVTLLNGYCQATGDETTKARMLPFARKIVAKAREEIRAGDLLVRGDRFYPDFPEWMQKTPEDFSLAPNLLFYQGLRSWQELSGENTVDLDKFREAVSKTFWNPEEGFWSDSADGKTGAFRPFYPSYGVFWVSRFAQDILEDRFESMGDVAAYMRRHFFNPAGIRTMDVHSPGYLIDGTHVGSYRPVATRNYWNVMNAAGETRALQDFRNIVKGMWRFATYPEGHELNYQNHDTACNMDLYGQKQAFSARAWLWDALELHLGLRVSHEGLRFHALADGRPFEVKGLTPRGRRLDVRVSGDGAIASYTLNGKPLKEGFVKWSDLREGVNSLSVRCGRFPKTAAKADTTVRGDTLMTCAEMSVTGGRVETPVFPCAKAPGECAYYMVSFKAKVKGGRFNYWWMDFFDRAGNVLADVNSKLYQSEEWRDYEELFQAVPEAVAMQNAYCVSAKSKYCETTGHADIRDVRLRRVGVDEAAAWCDRLYRTLPQAEDWDAPRDALWKLPRTRTALVRHRPLKIVMLGGSLCNDSYNGHFSAILKRAFPLSDITVVASVRGGTGIWFYEKPAAFKEYVLDLKPDLLVVAGICHRGPVRDCEMDREIYFERFVDLCRAHGIELVLCTPPLSKDFRPSPAPGTYDPARIDPGLVDVSLYENEYLRRVAEVKGVPLWDVTTMPCRALAQSGEPIGAWMRDIVHNDDRGKQVNARAIAAHFLTAIRDEYPEARTLTQIASDWVVTAADGTRRPFDGFADGCGVKLISQSWRLIPDPQGVRTNQLRIEYRASRPFVYRARFFDFRGSEIGKARLEFPASEGVAGEPDERFASLVFPRGARYVRHEFDVDGRLELVSFGVGKVQERD